MPRTAHIAPWISLFLFMAEMSLSSYSYGQSQHPLIEYSTENGLSINSINDLLFDKNGFLWVTTSDGLQRFDGYRFQTFKHDPFDKKSLPQNLVTRLYEDNDGNLWISYSAGIAFKPKGKFEFIDLSAYLHPDLKNGIYCVSENDSSVWILINQGIYSVNKSSLLTKKIFSLPELFGADGYVPLAKMYSKNDKMWLRKRSDRNGDLFLITQSGFQQYKNLQNVNILFLVPGEKDSLIVITDKQAYIGLTKDPFAVVRVLQEKFNSSVLDSPLVTFPRKIGNKQWMLQGTKKILVFDENTQEIKDFRYNNYFSNNINHYLNAITTDKSGNEWLGYDPIGGIKMLPQSLQKFNSFIRPDKNALPYCLAADNNGKIYTGIFRGDIEVYNKEGSYSGKIGLPASHKKSGSARAMAMIDSVTMIVRSTYDELYAIDTRNRHLKILSHLLPAKNDSVFTGDFEPFTQKIREGEVWLSYFNSILSIKKDRKGILISIVYTLPSKERITGFFRENNGRLWIGTMTGVGYFLNNSFYRFPLSVYAKNINQNQDGRIWITATNGVYIIRNDKPGNYRVEKQLNEKDGLLNSFVYGVLFDDAGNGWISTNRGIAKIVQGTPSGDNAWTITSYSAKEGLQGDEFNTKGFCKGPDGSLYFAGVNGINFFKPAGIINSEPSQTMLTAIEVNNISYQPALQPELINSIRLPSNQNNIRLSFACMDFTATEKNKFKFWLKGFQNDWTLPQTNNTVQYILPPGEYDLLVQGANYEGLWSKEPLKLHISILPPWYQTLWAKILFALLIIGAVGTVFYFISRNRYQKKLRRLEMEQEVQKEKQRLSRDLHDNLGSQLTWLSNTINQLERSQEEHQPMDKKLNQLKEGSNELMQTLRETIWIMNKEKIGAVDLFDKLVNHAARHIEAYPPLQLFTEEIISVDLQLSSGQALQLFRICQEAITNACKHAQATLLNIKADTADDRFTITIIDNGKGFDLKTNNSSGHYGLQNMQERAKESNLDFKISSSQNKGTIISVSLRQ